MDSQGRPAPTRKTLKASGLDPDAIEEISRALEAGDTTAAMTVALAVVADQPELSNKLDELGLLPREPPFATITAAALVMQTFPAIRWAVYGLVPEGLALMVGAPKLGKSWLGLGWAWAVAAGGFAVGKIKCEPGEALYLALEDNQRSLQARIKSLAERAGGPPPDRLHLTTELPTINPHEIPAKIEAWVRQHPNARLVVVDTLQRVRPPAGNGGSTSIYERDSNALIPFQSIARRYGVAVVMIHHTRKAESKDAFDTVSGSLGLNGIADTLLVLRRARNQADAVLHITGREVEESEHALQLVNGQWTLLGDARVYESSDERRQILEALRKSEEPMRVPDLVQIVEKSRTNVLHRLKGLIDEGLVKRLDRGLYTLVTPVTSSQLRLIAKDSGVTSGVTSSQSDDDECDYVTDVTLLHGEDGE